MTEIYWYQHSALPILALLQLLPLLGAVVLFKLKTGGVLIGRLFALAEFALAIALYRGFDVHADAMQFSEWLQIAGPLVYHASADGITVLFVLLAALLVVLLTLYGLVRGLEDPRRLLMIILALESVLMSQLVSLNLLWFALVSVAEIGLVGYLLWFWATSPEKGAMLVRFYQFQGVGVCLLLLGAGLLAWSHFDQKGVWSFDLSDLMGMAIPPHFAAAAFFLLFYGLGVRVPIFPFHGWLPVVARHGNIAIAPAFLLGVKVGIYAMARFILPILGDTAAHWQPFVAGFAVVGIFYAAFHAFMQSDLRRLLAFAVVSHTSLLVMGLFSLHPLGMQGSLLLAANFGLAVITMLFMTGFVYRRTHTTTLDQLGGLFDRIPLIGVTFLVGGLAIIGMPGTPGFDAAHLVLEASIEQYGALPTVIAALGNVAAAGFLLYAFQRAFLAPRASGKGVAVERTSMMETWVAGTLLVVMLAGGFYLEPWLDLVEAPLNALATTFDTPLVTPLATEGKH